MIDKTLWEEVDKIYEQEEVEMLNEMAHSLSAIKKELNNYSQQFTYHVFKCAVFGDTTGDLFHWCQEIGNYLDIVNDYIVKSSKSKPSEEVYKEEFFYYFGGDEESDYIGDLKRFKTSVGRRYSDFEVTPELASKAFSCIKDLADYFAPHFARKNNLTKLDIENKVYDYFNSYTN